MTDEPSPTPTKYENPGVAVRTTRDVLKVFWQGDEVPGITIYAYSPRQALARPSFPLDLWPPGTEAKTSHLSNETWLVWVWDLRVNVWPNPWKNCVESSLTRLQGPNLPVVWCGLEGYFVDPPRLFEAAMSEGVFAATSPKTGFICHSDLDEPFRPISVSEILELRSQIGRS